MITQAARVKVDRDTGVVRVLDFAAAHDSGVIINRMGADGQVYGGVMMGIGQALSEATWFDDAGRQLNPGLLDYKLQTAADGPPIQVRWIEVDTPNAGPKGPRGSVSRRASRRPARSATPSPRCSAATSTNYR